MAFRRVSSVKKPGVRETGIAAPFTADTPATDSQVAAARRVADIFKRIGGPEGTEDFREQMSGYKYAHLGGPLAQGSGGTAAFYNALDLAKKNARTSPEAIRSRAVADRAAAADEAIRKRKGKF